MLVEPRNGFGEFCASETARGRSPGGVTSVTRTESVPPNW